MTKKRNDLRLDAASFIDKWLSDPKSCDIRKCNSSYVKDVLEPRLASAWERNQDTERRTLLDLKLKLSALEENRQNLRWSVVSLATGIMAWVFAYNRWQTMLEVDEKIRSGEYAVIRQGADPYFNTAVALILVGGFLVIFGSYSLAKMILKAMKERLNYSGR